MAQPESSSADRPRCPQCGAELPRSVPPDQCPKCLLKAALAAEPAAGAGGTIVLSPPPASSRGLPQPGEQLGRYSIIRLLGAGGMGAVFEAEEMESGRRVALKVLSHRLDLPEARERFFREGRLAASINHPNSVYVFGTEEIGGTPVIAMELVSGGTLQDRVRAQGPMAVGAAVDCVLQVVAGLEAAQRVGILHRDIKPSNCYLGEDGSVKVGDFGLSISTAIRIEPALTATGAFLGTPAFCSPEQLRGDELRASSDMYSVGATLFYLLTGRAPFEGKNSVQELAAALEQPAPSPRKLRPDLPASLAKVVLRCLEKQPEARFKSYADLAAALTPFSSVAPTPATLGLRTLAGVLDTLLLAVMSTVISWSILGNPLEFMRLALMRRTGMLVWVCGWFVGTILYYALCESRWGATPGKAICRLRVVGPDRNPPALWRAARRAAMFVLIPVLPSWYFYGFVWSVSSSATAQTLVGLSNHVLLLCLFCTARRRNGFAALHDLALNLRVISRAAFAARPVLAQPETPPAVSESTAMLGPYHILEPLEQGPEVAWHLGFDLRLLRKVWLRVVPPGTAPFPAQLRGLGRVGRLRWLTGRRAPGENWDAFEALSGRPLLKLAQSPQPWSQVRFWIYDLAGEISIAEKDRTLPPVLALDRVWITADGRAKLLDFSAPGLRAETAAPPRGESSAPHFLDQVASVALGPAGVTQPGAGAQSPPQASGSVPVPLPLRVRRCLKQLPQLADAATIATALRPLLERAPIVSRWRRAAIVAGCVALPCVAGVTLLMGQAMAAYWTRSQPELMELSGLLQTRAAMRQWGSHRRAPTDREFAIYIASHYRGVITNQASWSDGLALAMIRGEPRQFAEASVADYPSPTSEDVSQAEVAVRPSLPDPRVFSATQRPWFPLAGMGIVLIVCVGLPTFLCAVLFRGGLVLRLAGVTLVRGDGVPASRARVLWRTVVIWAPCIALALLTRALAPTLDWRGDLLAAGIGMGVLTLLSLALKERGLQDWVAGTWPVPR